MLGVPLTDVSCTRYILMMRAWGCHYAQPWPEASGLPTKRKEGFASMPVFVQHMLGAVRTASKQHCTVCQVVVVHYMNVLQAAKLAEKEAKKAKAAAKAAAAAEKAAAAAAGNEKKVNKKAEAEAKKVRRTA